MKYNPNIHHRGSVRLKEYDYSSAGMYYVTICTHNRECSLGRVVDSEMRLNNIGSVVDLCWHQIPEHFANATLDVYQIMPNHLHGIIRILDISGRDLINQIPAHDKQGAEGMNANWPLMKNPKATLGKIIRSLKAQSTKKIHDAGFPAFAWQGSFNDHIVRDGRDLDRIRKYILDNPANWVNDENYPENIRTVRMHEGEEGWSALE